MSIFKQDLFKGKVLFITGGALSLSPYPPFRAELNAGRTGIGYVITKTMLQHGASAVIVGRDAKGLDDSAAKLRKETGGHCIAASADVRLPAQIKAAVEVAKKESGRIDFVICGAAGNLYAFPLAPNLTFPSPRWEEAALMVSLAPISGLSENAFRTVIEIDLLGTYNTIKATLPLLRESKGAYVHISATLHYRGVPYQSHVAAAKAGVDALSQALAVEEGPRGVRSNVVAPGPIAGSIGMERLTPKGMNKDKEIPLGKQGSPQDIANAALYLFSPAAAWITGAVFVVDGGHIHTAGSMVPYPEGVLDPESMRSLIKGKL